MSIESYDFKKGKVIDSRKRRVIMSEFEQEDLDTIQATLRDARFQIMGKEKQLRPLLELVRKHKIGVLVLNTEGPDVDVAKLLPEIRRKTPDISVILVSAHVDKELVTLASKEAVLGLLSSPIKQESMRKILTSID